jgi:hypothetical protein
MIFNCWFLEVQVLDGASNSVPSANVTATNQVNGRTQTQVTNQNGITRLLLAENMKNATGNFTVSQYDIQGTFEAYSNSTLVNITGDQELTITLSDLVVPEYSLLPAIFFITTGIFIVTYVAKRKLS